MPSSFPLQDHALIAGSLDAVPFGLVALSSAGRLLYANAWAANRLPTGEFLAMWDPAGRLRIEAALAADGVEGPEASDLVAADGSTWRVSMEPWRGSTTDEGVLVVSIQPAGDDAHDFNNLLQVISGNLQLLAADVAGNARAERRVANAMAGVSRALAGRALDPPVVAAPVAGAEAGLDSLRVLVVEDDTLIRMSICEMLDSRGHVVFEAGNGNEALRVHATEVVDVLLTDVGLPGMSGVELAERLREVQPDLPVLFATGDHRASGVQCDARTRILAKPYGVADLMEAITRIVRT